MLISVMFYQKYEQIIFSSVMVAEWPIFAKRPLFAELLIDSPCIRFSLCLFVNKVISHFAVEVRAWF